VGGAVRTTAGVKVPLLTAEAVEVLVACDGLYKPVPGLSITVPLSQPSRLDIAYAGTAFPPRVVTGSAYTQVLVNGIVPSAGNAVVGGCQQSATAVDVYTCSAGTHAVTPVMPVGSHTVSVYLSCTGSANMYLRFNLLRVVVYPG
jgi:hypothetical protein